MSGATPPTFPKAKPDPKPQRRKRESRHRYTQMCGVMLRRHPSCECGCGRRAESIHHVIRRTHGDDVYENFVTLAGDGTRLCHGAYTSKQRVWDEARGVYIDPLEVAYGLRRRMETVRLDVLAYVLAKRGRDWVDKHYPVRPG